MRLFAIALLFACCSHRPAVQSGSGAGLDVLTITNATVLSASSSVPQRNVTVVVRAGRIVSVDSSGGGSPASGGTVIDLENRWLLPGLIDAHVHFRDLASARRALASGVTTARSPGTDHFADVGIRELALMADAGACLVPTLSFWADMAAPAARTIIRNWRNAPARCSLEPEKPQRERRQRA